MAFSYVLLIDHLALFSLTSLPSVPVCTLPFHIQHPARPHLLSYDMYSIGPLHASLYFISSYFFLSHIHLNGYGNSLFPERNLTLGEEEEVYSARGITFVLYLIGKEISGFKILLTV